MSNISNIKELLSKARAFVMGDPKCIKFKRDIALLDQKHKTMLRMNTLPEIMQDENKCKRLTELKETADRLKVQYSEHVKTQHDLEQYSPTLFRTLLYHTKSMQADCDSAVDSALKVGRGEMTDKDAINRGNKFVGKKYKLPANFFKKL